jgi:hypothetical protein
MMFLSFFPEVILFFHVPDPQHRLKLRYNSLKSRYSYINRGGDTTTEKRPAIPIRQVMFGNLVPATYGTVYISHFLSSRSNYALVRHLDTT